MFGSLKRLFSKPPSAPPPAQAEPIPAPPLAAAPPLPPPPAPVAPPPETPAGETIAVPLRDIILKLPGSLAPLAIAAATGTVPIPIKTVLAQLPNGAIRISFGQLRRTVPSAFANNAEFDETLIDLPLPQILALLDPSLLTRRAGQKQVKVADDITGVFAARDKNAVRVAPPVTPLVPTPPIPMPGAPKPKPLISPAPSAPKLPTTAITPAPSAPKPVTPAPMPFVAHKPVTQAPLPFATTRPSPPPSTPKAAPVTGEVVTVKLVEIYEFWPDGVREEITQAQLTGASVSIPLARLDAALKTGRVTIAWSELIEWLDAAPLSASAHGETQLELPLKVIAPLFMSKRKISTPQKTVTVGANIPDLFTGLGKASAPAAAAPPPAPSFVPAAAPVAKHSEVSTNILGEIFGQPAKKEWSPQEIAAKINTLPGVAGSVIGMADGLLVAGQAPSSQKAETVAAFLPQIFGRMFHYAGEIQLGSLTALTLQTGQGACVIFKCGALYLAVLGKPGENLPEPVLRRIAGELAKRTE